MTKKLNFTAPFQENHFLRHPQLGPYFKFYCYFNALVRPNLQSWTGFDLLIISGVKFWWFSFLAVTWQLNRSHCPLLCLLPLTIRVFTTLQSDPRDLWPLRHLFRVMRRHDMTKKLTKKMTKTKTFWEHLLRAILETCDLWDIWSEWWAALTWPTKRQ